MKATLLDVCHLPCFQDALVDGRHPVLSSRDLASLAVAAGLPKSTLQPLWDRIARDTQATMEGASPPCRALFRPTKLCRLASKESLFALDASQISLVALRMHLTENYATAAETAVAILAAHDAACNSLAYPLPYPYVAALAHLRGWRVTETTALNEWKLRPSDLDALECKLLPNPYGGGHDMRLYRLPDVAQAAECRGMTWVPKPGQPFRPSLWDIVAGVRVIACPAPSGKKRGVWLSEADVHDAAEAARVKRLEKRQLWRDVHGFP